MAVKRDTTVVVKDKGEGEEIRDLGKWELAEERKRRKCKKEKEKKT